MKRSQSTEIKVKPLNLERVKIKIRGCEGVPLVVHNWSEKAIREMLQKQMAAKAIVKAKEPKDPEADYRASLYLIDSTGKERYGFPAAAFKESMVRAVKMLKDTKQTTLDMIAARQALFVLPDGQENREISVPLSKTTTHTENVCTDLVEIKGKPRKRMDMVRIGMGTSDIRFRAEFTKWEAVLRIEYNADVLDKEMIANLVCRAGMTVGIGEGRPEKKGADWGKYEPYN